MGKTGLSRSDKSLATNNPNVMQYWDYSLNTHDPFLIGAKSNVKVWWKCLDKENHSWEAKPDYVTKRPEINCPYCCLTRLHEDNSLSTLYPHLAKEFHVQKNGILPTDIIGNASSKRYWWICSEGHEWEAILGNRVRLSSGCPACSGRVAHAKNNLAVLHPEIAKELNVEKTGKEAHEFVSGSDIHVWWTCSAKNHEWKTAVSTRTKLGSGCPYCANQKINEENSLQALFPDIAKELNVEKNGLSADEVGAGALKWVWWKCHKGHEWESAISNRTSQSLGCPKCSARSTSKIEKLFRKTLQEQEIFDNIDDNPYRIKISDDNRKFIEIDIHASFDNKNIAIEYDGSYYHQNNIGKDTAKTQQLLDLGYFVIRIREQSSNVILPFLDFQHKNFLQVRHVYRSRQDDVSETIVEILHFLSSIKDNTANGI